VLQADDVHFKLLDDATKDKVYEGIRPLLDKRFDHLVFEDAGFRIAGTSSLGLQRYCVLCYSKKKGKHYLIDLKEARTSCYTSFIKVKQPDFLNEANRVNKLGYLMQFNSPAFSEMVRIDHKWFVIKELQYQADRMSLADYKNDFGALVAVAKEMAVLMAYSHLRSSGHLGASTADDLRRFAEKKQWQRNILEFSFEMAQRNRKYYKEFTKAD
jgi:uncharacterized protein (DUF2252 family)